jgi:hypothetical protein
VTTDPEDWEPFSTVSAGLWPGSHEFARSIRHAAFKRHKQGPKPDAEAHQTPDTAHVSTARLLRFLSQGQSDCRAERLALVTQVIGRRTLSVLMRHAGGGAPSLKGSRSRRRPQASDALLQGMFAEGVPGATKCSQAAHRAVLTNVTVAKCS